MKIPAYITAIILGVILLAIIVIKFLLEPIVNQRFSDYLQELQTTHGIVISFEQSKIDLFSRHLHASNLQISSPQTTIKVDLAKINLQDFSGSEFAVQITNLNGTVAASDIKKFTDYNQVTTPIAISLGSLSILPELSAKPDQLQMLDHEFWQEHLKIKQAQITDLVINDSNNQHLSLGKLQLKNADSKQIGSMQIADLSMLLVGQKFSLQALVGAQIPIANLNKLALEKAEYPLNLIVENLHLVGLSTNLQLPAHDPKTSIQLVAGEIIGKSQLNQQPYEDIDIANQILHLVSLAINLQLSLQDLKTSIQLIADEIMGNLQLQQQTDKEIDVANQINNLSVDIKSLNDDEHQHSLLVKKIHFDQLTNNFKQPWPLRKLSLVNSTYTNQTAKVSLEIETFDIKFPKPDLFNLIKIETEMQIINLNGTVAASDIKKFTDFNQVTTPLTISLGSLSILPELSAKPDQLQMLDHEFWQEHLKIKQAQITDLVIDDNNNQRLSLSKLQLNNADSEQIGSVQIADLSMLFLGQKFSLQALGGAQIPIANLNKLALEKAEYPLNLIVENLHLVSLTTNLRLPFQDPKTSIRLVAGEIIGKRQLKQQPDEDIDVANQINNLSIAIKSLDDEYQHSLLVEKIHFDQLANNLKQPWPLRKLSLFNSTYTNQTAKVSLEIEALNIKLPQPGPNDNNWAIDVYSQLQLNARNHAQINTLIYEALSEQDSDFIKIETELQIVANDTSADEYNHEIILLLTLPEQNSISLRFSGKNNELLNMQANWDDWLENQHIAALELSLDNTNKVQQITDALIDSFFMPRILAIFLFTKFFLPLSSEHNQTISDYLNNPKKLTAKLQLNPSLAIYQFNDDASGSGGWSAYCCPLNNRTSLTITLEP